MHSTIESGYIFSEARYFRWREFHPANYDINAALGDFSGRNLFSIKLILASRSARLFFAASPSFEDFAEEKSQVVVLREGKHLTEREPENVRRVGTQCHSRATGYV